jgi:hypothetical protein
MMTAWPIPQASIGTGIASAMLRSTAPWPGP